MLSLIVINKSNNIYIEKILNIDVSLFIAINEFQVKLPTELDQFMILITLYGREIFLPFVLILIFIFGGKNGRKTVIITGISILILIPLVSIIKDYIERPRPFVPDLDTLMSADTNYSFPSGHSTLIVAGAVTTLILFKGNKYTKILPIVLVIDAGLVCFSRIYVGVHYPFDVIGGFFLGSGISLLIIYIIDNLPKIRTIISNYKCKDF
ncbi:MAG TPA: phosphatase PAP2 family protein [Nitrososphaeraceae archaeon]|nr:phosphatase PAP2 family protein [Nitrososphaeraceae archaeon]